MTFCRIVYDSSDDDADGDQSDYSAMSDYNDHLRAELARLFAPLPLSMQCRNAIRRHVIGLHGTARIKQVMSSLPVPANVRDFLALVNINTHCVIR